VWGPYEEVAKWRRLHNKELRNLNGLPNITREIKTMRWAGHVAGMGEMRSSYDILVGKPEGDHSENLGVSGKIISEWILGKKNGRVLTGCI